MAKVWMNAVELAAYLDMSQANVTKLTKAGLFQRDPKRKLFHSATCRVDYIRHLREGAAGRDVSREYDRQRQRQMRARADQTEMQNQMTRGDLLQRDEVVAMWQAIIATARAAILAMPSRLAPVLIVIEDLAEAHQTIKDYAREILENLADDPIQPGVSGASAASGRDVATTSGDNNERMGRRQKKAKPGR